MTVSLSGTQGRKKLSDAPVVCTSVAGGAPVRAAMVAAESTSTLYNSTPLGNCSHGVAGIDTVAEPAPTCVTRRPRR